MNDPHSKPASATPRFVTNVIWNWMGMGASVVAAFLLTPYMIRHMGDQLYGVWSLAYSLIEYCWLLDLGFRSATITYVAHYHAKKDIDSVNSVINTSLVYYTCLGLLVATLAVVVSPYIPQFFKVPPEMQRELGSLIRLIGISWGLGAMFLVFQATLEGMQRFELTSRIVIVTNVLRAVAWTTVLSLGHGAVALVGASIAVQMVGYLMHVWYLQRVFDGLRLSLSLFRVAQLKELAGFGVHTFLVTVSQQVVTQTPPLLIGHWMPVAFVGYYNVATRILTSSVSEIVARVGVVSAPRAAELAAHGDLPAAARLTINVNRYCLLLVMPVCILFGVFGYDILSLWINPQVAKYTMPILLPLLIGAGVIASQFNSSSVLYGLAGHQRYAKGFAVEAVTGIAAMFLIGPRLGGVGLACVVAIVGGLNRGVFTSWLISQRLELSWRKFLVAIYGRPLLAGGLVLGAAWLIRSKLAERINLIELVAVAAAVMAFYAVVVLAMCIPRTHKVLLYEHIQGLRKRFMEKGVSVF